jgi:membrane associated rhomboid family serine protease
MFQGTKAVKTIFYLNVGIFALLSILDLIGVHITGLFCAWNWETKNFIPFQLITYQFLHGGILHLLFNMLAFVSLAPLVENYLGERKFYIYYLLCGIFSAVLHIQMVGGTVPLVGASGSIWGVTAMFALLHPNEKLNIMFIPIHFKAKHLIGILFGIELFFCIFASQGSISHWGHVGGAITGIVLFLVEKYLYKNAN